MCLDREELKKKIETEVQKYLHSSSQYKEYTQSMKDVSVWLEKKMKK